MFETVAVPVWLLLLVVILAAWVMVERVMLPSVRWYFRGKVNKVLAELNERLPVKIDPFRLTKRQVLIDRLVYDSGTQAAADDHMRENLLPREVVMGKVSEYAREIVPAFNAYVYFRIGNALARWVAKALYRVRVGHEDYAWLRDAQDRATVVFVMNHRSNMDYILVAFLASEKTAISYAVGEWARVPGLQSLIKWMGAFFVRRNSNDKLYRQVLERYVRIATDSGVCQAMFPEGGLSRDGHLRPPKLGLMDYMLKGWNPQGERDLIFVPIGINYDRVLEDRTLLRSLDSKSPPRSTTSAVKILLGFMWQNIRLIRTGQWHRFGYACVNFGTAVSMREYCREKGYDFRIDQREDRFAKIQELADHVMGRVGEIVPILPVSLVAHAAMRQPYAAVTHLELRNEAQRIFNTLSVDQRQIYVPRQDEEYAIEFGIKNLTLRHLLIDDVSTIKPNPDHLHVLRYYANSIDHLFPPHERLKPVDLTTLIPEGGDKDEDDQDT